MFPFRKRTDARSGLDGLALCADGIAFARVRREGPDAPVLEACEWRPAGGAGEWEAGLGALAREWRLRRRPCNVVLEPEAYALALVEAPQVPPEELRAAVRWRVRDLIDFHVDDAVIDVFDLPPLKGEGRPPMMYAVAARAPEVARRCALVQEQGVDLRAVDITELALRNLAAQLPEDVAGVALVQVSRESGVVTLTRRGTLYLARRLAFGTVALGETGATLAASADPARRWLDGLVLEVQRSLDYFESNFDEAPISSVVLAPSDVRVDGAAAYVADQLGLAARELELGRLVEGAADLDPPRAARCLGALGAALRREEASP